MPIHTPHYPRFTILLIFLVFLLVTLACNGSSLDSLAPPVAAETQNLAIDPLFIDFYNSLEGSEILGPAISTLIISDNIKLQYTLNALMIYDPQASDQQPYRLAPIGKKMGITMSPVPPPQESDARYVGDHLIDERFMPLYQKLGLQITGIPLTESRFNPTENRIEQYFENVGFYDSLGQPDDGIKLLAYGAWGCPSTCQIPTNHTGKVFIVPLSSSPFQDKAAQLGQDLTGFALTEPYHSGQDGMLEQVFENLVLYSDNANPGMVLLRQLPEKIGILPEKLLTPDSDMGARPNMFFIPVEGDFGHYIHESIYNYIMGHGGIDNSSGKPITEGFEEALPYNRTVQRQCFVHLCLDMDTTAPPPLQVHPAPLGYIYLQLTPPSTPRPTETATPQPEVSLQVWVGLPSITSQQEQEIFVSVMQNHMPVSNIVPEIDLTMADGSQQQHVMPPTGEDGRSSLRLPPIPARSYTLIPFQVCIPTDGGQKFCVKEQFHILNKP